MSDFAPEFTASASFSDGGSGALVFTALPSVGVAAVVFPFFKGDPGPMGPPANVIPTWDYYVINWTTAPAQVGTTAAGAVWSHTLSGTTRYRLVPSPYVAAQDGFYATWNGSVLSSPIVFRG